MKSLSLNGTGYGICVHANVTKWNKPTRCAIREDNPTSEATSDNEGRDKRRRTTDDHACFSTSRYATIRPFDLWHNHCICCCSANFPSCKPHTSVILLPAALPQSMKRPSTERMMSFVANGRLHTTAQNPLVLVRRRAPVTCALCPVTCVVHGLSCALATPKPRSRGFQKVIIPPSVIKLHRPQELLRAGCLSIL
jgi:hypothetical protein